MRLLTVCTLSSFCIILLFASSCVDRRTNNQEGELAASVIVPLQATVDSASELYLNAIEELQNGQDLETVKTKYSTRLKGFHNRFSMRFDSLTKEYMRGAITQEQYDEVRNSISLDTVQKRSEQLEQLGLKVDLD